MIHAAAEVKSALRVEQRGTGSGGGKKEKKKGGITIQNLLNEFKTVTLAHLQFNRCVSEKKIAICIPTRSQAARARKALAANLCRVCAAALLSAVIT